jgi:hypothetical protein
MPDRLVYKSVACRPPPDGEAGPFGILDAKCGSVRVSEIEVQISLQMVPAAAILRVKNVISDRQTQKNRRGTKRGRNPLKT